jgi:hypothetical protein
MLEVSKLGISKFSCNDVALQELRERLIALQNSDPIQFAALLGENNNLLGIGRVEDVDDGTARIAEGALIFTVNLCCVCSIVEGNTVPFLIQALREFGVIPPLTASTLYNLGSTNQQN